ncbi:MAG: metalloregulator ArsR/SmtB family transcription factor [Solirubrobacteraceae bacterium]
MTADESCELLCIDMPKAESLRRSLPAVECLESAAAGAKALADPTRLRLALALRDGEELCVCDLAWISERQEKLVSHHLRQLRAAGLARSRKDGRMVLYSLTDLGRLLLAAVARELPDAVTR